MFAVESAVAEAIVAAGHKCRRMARDWLFVHWPLVVLALILLCGWYGLIVGIALGLMLA
jgi:hypothetical protein